MSFILLFFIVLLFVFITGLCVGSFLNVVVLRAFSNESIAYPPSKCPKCQKPLKWYHNIPVLSFVLLRGKCAYCKEKISIQYPLIEIITGLLFVIIFMKYGFDINALFVFAFASLFVVIATTDIKEKVVFDFHTYSLIILGLIYNFFNFGHLYFGQKITAVGSITFAINNSFIASIIGLIVGVIIMEGLARFGYLVAGTRAFGEGDSYIAAGLGAVFGFKYLITILIYSLIIQIIFTIPVYFKKLFLNKDFKTIAALSVFFALAIIFKVMSNTYIFNNTLILLTFLILLCAFGIYACKRILGGIKNQENVTYLPFGPAMVISALIVILII